MNIQEMMKQAKKMQEKIEKAKKELEIKEFVIKKHGIELTMLGNYQLKNLEFDENLLDPDDKEILQDLIVLAINEATSLIKEAHELIEPQKNRAMF